MTEEEWDKCADPLAMLEFLQKNCKFSRRKRRLFAVACCRSIWSYLKDEQTRIAVEVAERYAEGFATRADLAKVCPEKQCDAEPCLAVAWGVAAPNDWTSAKITCAATVLVAVPACSRLTIAEMLKRGEDDAVRVLLEHSNNQCKVEEEKRAALLRDICGFAPFQATGAKTFSTPKVLNLAQEIYDSRAFDRLPVLGDVLAEAGCDNADILAHCRSAGQHVRGCWAVDLVLGKV